MSHTKELEIKQQFLDEAQEYLETLEATLLGIAETHLDTEKINGALRAAHSIKGGAGLMGYSVLNQLAHQLEDSLKVLKVQKQQLEIDSELERLLLSAVDCLVQVVTWTRQETSIDHYWLEHQAQPIFEQLHQRLGDPQEEDMASMLSPEDGQNIIPVLFETEIEGCLQRLESILAGSQPSCLNEEVMILAQELEGLGEMLQLPAFKALCRSVVNQLEATPEQHQAIAERAVAAWRRSQALVLTGQIELLPTALTDFDATEDITSSNGFTPAATNKSVPVATPVAVSAADPVVVEPMLTNAEMPTSEIQAILQSEELHDVSVTAEVIDAESRSTAEIPAPASRSFKVEAPPDSFLPGEEAKDTTVRVSVNRLNGLNDLMGELTTERNGLMLNINRLRNLMNMLKQRVQTLEASNSQLRSAYDQVSLQQHSAEKKALVASAQVNNRNESRLTIQSTSIPNNDFDALEMDRYSGLHLVSQEMIETIVQIQEVTGDIELELEETEQTGRNFNKTGKQLQRGLTQVRMRPLADVLDRFPRALRELCLQHNKEAELKVVGGSTLVDRTILENLADPLMHLLRNAFDHGLETPDIRIANGKSRQGLIEIYATHRHNRTVIQIKDDGQGISLNKIRHRAELMGLDADLLAAASEQELLSLIFEPGFSTSTQVTDLSGRGVGMDVVRNNLRQINGDITVDTEPNRGTTFTLSVPYTLSVARILLAESQNMALAVPTDVMEEILLLPPEDISSKTQKEVIQWGNRSIPLVRLSDWLLFNGPRPTYKLESTPTIDTFTVLVVNHGGQSVGLQVDRCWGEQEVAIRRIEGDLPLPPGFSNCTILGDGRVVPLVSIPELLHWLTSNQRAAIATPNSTGRLAYQLTDQANHKLDLLSPKSSHSRLTMLIVDDSIIVRRFLALTLEKAGYRVEQARDGQDALDKLQDGLHPQAIICDIEMPRLDGYGFLAKAKADSTLGSIPVIMLTSRSGKKHRQLAINLGATDYFSKPYNEHLLLQKLEEIVK